MHQQQQLNFFVIDYLQSLHSTARRAENRQLELADISGGIKTLAKELDVPIIVLNQRNRELEREKNRKPRMSALPESGSFEQDADLSVCYINQTRAVKTTRPDLQPARRLSRVNLLIAQKWNGPTGDGQFDGSEVYT
jgi:replicative DNA helicase